MWPPVFFLLQRQHEWINVCWFQRGHLWQLSWEPVCYVWWCPSVLGCLGCYGLPPADKVSIISYISSQYLQVFPTCQKPNSRTDSTESRCRRWCSLFVWCPLVGSEAVSASLSGSVIRAPSHRRLSWTPCVLTSGSTLRYFISCMIWYEEM